MTCIVGIEHKGNIWMGADSISVSGWDTSINSIPKLFKIDNRFLIGVSGLTRTGQIIQYSLKVDQQESKISDYEFIINKFVPSLRKILKQNNNAKTLSNETESDSGGNLLVGFNGKLYKIGVAFGVVRCSNGYVAIGAGADYAKGSLYATKNKNTKPKTKILNALKAANYHSTYVQEPFIIERLINNG